MLYLKPQDRNWLDSLEDGDGSKQLKALVLAFCILPPFLIAGIWRAGVWVVMGFKEKAPPKLD